MRAVRKQGKGELFRTSRLNIIKNLSFELWQAYCGATLSYADYRALLDHLRESLSWDALLGIKQLSIYDLLDDEKLVETMTADNESEKNLTKETSADPEASV